MKRGTVVRDRYTIQTLAGTGGMGSVYLALDPEGNRVALKVLNGGRRSMDMRFAREARILMQLEHPGIVGCFDSGVTENGERFLALEWLDGIDVETHLRSQPFALDEGLALAENVARALGFAHGRGLVHRDVKPSNIFLLHGDVKRPKLLDFGVAHWSDATSLTATGVQIGTPSYMAPEQIRGDTEIGPPADVFSLGCVLYKCLTGQLAFAGGNRMALFYKILLNSNPQISEVMRDVPPAVSELLERMMAKEPRTRLQDGNEVADAIAQVRTGLSERSRTLLERRPESLDSLTTSERQLVSVVVVGKPPGEDSTFASGNQGVTMFLENHGESDEAVASLREMRARHESMGVSFDSLADGSLIAILDTRRTAIDQAADAARCALELRSALPGQPMAVTTGRAETGQTYHSLGEVIGRAAALVANGAGSMLDTDIEDGTSDSDPATLLPIFIDDMTAELIEGRFEITGTPGNLILQGQSQKNAQSVLLGKQTPFVGRKREMSTLSVVLDECLDDGVARAVILTGPPGIGKSRLQREFRRMIAERGADIHIWRGRGDPMRSGSPLEVIAQAIRASADIVEDAPLEIRRNKLRARVARTVPEDRVEHICAFIGKLIKTPWSFEDDVQLQAALADARLMGDRVRRGCEELLAADLLAHPVVLIIDDFQWCSRATVAWIDRILRNLAEQPLMVVAFARPEVHKTFPDLWASHDPDKVRMRALSKRAAHELVRAVLGKSFDPQRAVEMIERADGNALYLEGLIRSAKGGRQDLPESMLAMVHSQLNELRPPVRRVLRAASVFGKRFWRDGVAALLGKTRSLDKYIQHLLTAELIARSQTSKFADRIEYRFRHDVIRDAAYSMLTDEDRRMGHRLAGTWLEKAGESDPLVVASHYQRGGMLDQALRFFEQAADLACNAGDFDAAIASAERGVACGAKDEALGALRAVQAKARYWDGQLQRAATTGEQAIALLAHGSRAWYDAIGITSLVRFRRSQAYEVERYARTFPESPPPGHERSGWLRLGAELSGYLFLEGHVDTADDLLDRVEEEIGDLDSAAPLLAGRVHRAMATRAAFIDGNPAEELEQNLLALASYQKAGDERRVCLESINVGRTQMQLGLFDEAMEGLRSSLEVAVGLAVDLLVDLARLYTSVALSYQNDLEDAIALAEQCVDSFERRGNRRLAATTYIHLSRYYMLDGRMDAAESSANLAMTSCLHTSPVHAHAIAALARVLLERGQSEDALNTAVNAENLLLDIGSIGDSEAQIRLVYAECLHATAQHEAARIAIFQARRRLQERAALIERDDWRAGFLERVPENARTLELARRWGAHRSSTNSGFE